jgi:hypothetical protein
MAAGIDEAGSSDAPRPIHRAVQELHTAFGQLGADGVDVIDRDRELEAGTGVDRRDDGRLDHLRRRGRLEQVDHRAPEGEHGRVVVLERHGQSKDLAVELLRRRQVLDEQGDGEDPLGPRGDTRTVH